MAPLVHMVFRQSRTLRDVIVTSCMLDLAQEDVSTALDLGIARVEGVLRSAVMRLKAGLLPERWPARMLRAFHQARKLWPMLILTGWFALPMTAVAGVCAALISFEMRMGP